MDTIVLEIKRGVGADADRWLWYLDRGGGQLAHGVEDTHVECFAVAAATLCSIEDAVAGAYSQRQRDRNGVEGRTRRAPA